MAESLTIAFMAISVMFNVAIILLWVGFPPARRSFFKFWKWLKWKSRGYMAVIMIGRNKVAREKLIKTESDGSLTYADEKYTPNPLAAIFFEGVPTQIFIEGITEAHDPFGTEEGKKMSTAEITRIILNANADDLIGSLKTFMKYALYVGGAMLIVILVLMYFNYNIYDVVVQGGTGISLSPN